MRAFLQHWKGIWACTLTVLVLAQDALACSYSQVLVKTEAGAIRVTANLDGKAMPGLNAILTRLEKRVCESGDDDDCDEGEWVPAGKSLTDQSGCAMFAVKKGKYRLEVNRGELSSALMIEVTSENEAVVPIAVEWPRIDRMSARTASGNLSAERLRDSGKGYIHDIALRRGFEVGPYHGARVGLLTLDNREVAVADASGNFVLPAQLPGYYLLKITRPSESKPFHQQADPEITALLQLADDAKFPDLSMRMNNVCGGSFTQDAQTH
jgi:hypothetical protein